jgi:hypothetical protein
MVSEVGSLRNQQGNNPHRLNNVKEENHSDTNAIMKMLGDLAITVENARKN